MNEQNDSVYSDIDFDGLMNINHENMLNELDGGFTMYGDHKLVFGSHSGGGSVGTLATFSRDI